jgi:tRNA dimethylallyltransferase
VFVVEGVPHHLMDDVDPAVTRTVTEWREAALAAIRDMVSRGKLPIVVGGTGLYIRALVDSPLPPAVPPQMAWRASTERVPLAEQVARLLALDPAAATHVDLKNPRRVLRALEVVEATGKPLAAQRRMGEPLVEAFQVGLLVERAELYRRIEAAVDRQLADGWVEEVRRLHAEGIPWEAPAMTSIGYRDVACFLQGALDEGELVRRLKRDTRQYAKRQQTWFGADARINWVKTTEAAEELVRRLLAS